MLRKRGKEMEKIYSLEIKFPDERHCIDCPLKDLLDDSCRMQVDEEGECLDFENWKEQMKNCPLKLKTE